MGAKRNPLPSPFRGFLVAKCLIASVVAWPVMTLVLQAKGMSFLDIGVLNSFGALVSLIFEVPMGRLADKFGQKRALTLGAIFVALGLAVLAIFDAKVAIYTSEFIVGIGMALSSGADSAWLFTEHKRLGMEDDYLRTLSAVSSKTTLLSAASNAVGPVLFAWATAIPLWVSVALYLATALVWSTLNAHADSPADSGDKSDQESEGDADTAGEKASGNGNSLIGRAWSRIKSAVKANRLFIALSFVSMLVTVAISNYSTFLGPFLKSRGLPVQYLGTILIVGTLAKWVAGRSAYRLKRDTHAGRTRIIAIIGLAVLGFMALSILFPGRPWAGAVAYVFMSGLATLFYILLDEQVNLVISDQYRATMLSVVAMFDEVSTIVIDPLIGYSLDALGFSRAYLLIAGVLAVGLSLSAIIGIRFAHRRLAS